jgi:hypothetical protein
MVIQRSRASPEPENPHIKRGMKGFVEFPRVVRAIGSKNKHRGTKLECQNSKGTAKDSIETKKAHQIQ